jgi:hypothetical protein
MYDVIGDIHGHADALLRLLQVLGYEKGPDCWRHPERQVIFLGDFVDRGPEIKKVLETARSMVIGGAALAVMGNHEFNAVAFHMEHPTMTTVFLRERSYKNIRQYMQTVSQLKDTELDMYTEWFQTLPMWLDLDGLRIVHACWDPRSMRVIEEHRERCGGYTDEFFHKACDQDEELFEAVEVVLKGKEVALPEGSFFFDKDENERRHVRTKWFTDPQSGDGTYSEYAFSVLDSKRSKVLREPLAAKTIEEAVPYGADEPPVLFGHYWMPGNLQPAPLAPNVACLDYSVARGGRLCAYRWDGESRLAADHFVHVPAIRQDPDAFEATA